MRALLLSLGVVLGLALIVGAAPRDARAQTEQPLVADLSHHLVAITTGFAGTDVLLFGATDGPGDVVMVVRGPRRDEVVYRKERLAGMIWANGASVTMHDVPAFYRVASSRPLDEIMTPATRARHEIGADVLNMGMSADVTPEERRDFSTGLVRLKEDQDLYSTGPGTISMLANRLFRTDLYFPANVPTGTYLVEVYLVRDGDVVSAEITPLIISKVGIGADVYQFAHEQSALYGIIAILLAVAAGWLAGVVFRKK